MLRNGTRPSWPSVPARYGTASSSSALSTRSSSTRTEKFSLQMRQPAGLPAHNPPMNSSAGRSTPSFTRISVKIVGERVAEMLAMPGTAMPLMRQKFLRVNGDPVEVEVMATSLLGQRNTRIPGHFPGDHRSGKNGAGTQGIRGAGTRTLAESASDMIYITDTRGRLLYANPACAQMCGCQPADIPGKTQEDLFPRILPGTILKRSGMLWLPVGHSNTRRASRSGRDCQDRCETLAHLLP